MTTTYTDGEIDRLLREAYADTEPLAGQSHPSWEPPPKVRRRPVAPLVLAGAAATAAVAGIVLTRADPNAPAVRPPASSMSTDPASAEVTLTPVPGGSASAARITVSAEIDRMLALREAAVMARVAQAGREDPGFSAVVGDHDASRTVEITVYRVGGATDAARTRYGNLDREQMALYFHDAVSSAAQREKVLRAFVERKDDLRADGVRLTFLDDSDPEGWVVIGYDPAGSVPQAAHRAIFEKLAPGAVHFRTGTAP